MTTGSEAPLSEEQELSDAQVRAALLELVVEYGRREWWCGHKHGMADHPDGHCQECSDAKAKLVVQIDRLRSVAPNATALAEQFQRWADGIKAGDPWDDGRASAYRRCAAALRDVANGHEVGQDDYRETPFEERYMLPQGGSVARKKEQAGEEKSLAEAGVDGASSQGHDRTAERSGTDADRSLAQPVPSGSCLVCGHLREFAVWLDLRLYPAGCGVCKQCRDAHRALGGGAVLKTPRTHEEAMAAIDRIMQHYLGKFGAEYGDARFMCDMYLEAISVRVAEVSAERLRREVDELMNVPAREAFAASYPASEDYWFGRAKALAAIARLALLEGRNP